MPRTFSDEQLKQLSKPLSVLAQEALDAGDYANCHLLLQQMANAHATLHALGTATLARIWGKWHREHGEQTTVALLDRIGKRMMEPYIKQMKEQKEKETFDDLLALYKHQIGATITPASQQGDEITFNLSPCGSGGNFLLRGYEEKYPQWHRRLKDRTPVFCRGCQSLQKALNEEMGSTVWSTDINTSVTGACTMTFHRQRRGDAPLYSSAELYRMTRTRAQQAIEKAAAGNYNIKALIDNQQHDWKPWHDTIMCWSEYTFAACIELGGMDYLDECLKECYDSAFTFIYKSMESFKTDAQRVAALAQNWHYHIGAFRLEEEEDRFVFILDPCGSGGRIFREEMHKDMFHYGTELAPIVQDSHNMTFQRKDFPAYCSHCASGNRDQFDGNPLVFVIDGHAQMQRGMACRQYVWKKDAPRKVEQALLDQVGMEQLIPVKQLDQ